MATITIQKQDGIVVVDGYATYDQDVSALASNIWAIQFDSTSNTGHIEYNDDTVNATITSLTSDMQALVTLNTNAKATADAEETATKNSYQYKRGLEYPTIGDQLDSLYHAGTFDATMTATIKAVKDKYPK